MGRVYASSTSHHSSPTGVKDHTHSPPKTNGYIDDIEEDFGYDPLQEAILAEQEENQKLRDNFTRVCEENRILSNRLQNAGESVSPQAGDSELLIPEFSHDLDNLLRENIHLKREALARSSTSMSSQIEQEREQLAKERDQVARERDQVVRERDQLASDLRRALSVQDASSDDKVMLIQQLTQQVSDTRDENQELTAQCRQLVQQQDEYKRSFSIAENFQKLSLEDGSPLSIMFKQNEDLQAQNMQIRSKFQEAIEKWKGYDEQREAHVQEVQQQLAHASGSTTSQLRDCANEQHMYLLNVNRAMEDRIQHLERTIKTTPSQEMQEQNDALKNQVEVYREDFEQERKDREQARMRIVTLEEDNDLLKQQLDQFQSLHMSYLTHRRASTMDRYREEYERQKGMLISHGTSYPYGHVVPDGADDEDEDTIDMEPSTSSLPAQQKMLECPKCHQQFPVDEPMQFLEHNDQCNS